LLHQSGLLRSDQVLHFHRLEDYQGLSCKDVLTRLGPDADYDGLHRSTNLDALAHRSVLAASAKELH
jgi:hypothetical protein